MTNLRNGVSPALLSRDRILVGVPLLVGVLLAVGVGVGILRPTLERVDSLEARLVDLQDQQRSFPGLERRLVEAQTTLGLREQKQLVLLDLIAGRERIQTFLALLGQEAQASGVVIRRYEPLAPPKSPVQSTGRRSRSSETAKPESAKTPMQDLGYHQSSIALQVSGGYAGLQQFLQRMERLQLLVESSELSLTTTTPASKPDQDQSVSLEPAPTDLSLRLTFYDRKPKADSPSTSQLKEETAEIAPS